MIKQPVQPHIRRLRLTPGWKYANRSGSYLIGQGFGLTLIADGDISHAELTLLDELEVHQQLGLTRDALYAVIDTFCEDLLSSKQLNWADVCPVDEYTLTELMAEIDDPELRRKVLGLCVRLAEADDKVVEGESLVLSAAVGHWSLHHQMLLRWF